MRFDTLPVEVLDCVLSRDTGLTGKDGWKSVFTSHELHNKPGRVFFSLLSIFSLSYLCGPASGTARLEAIGWFGKVRAGFAVLVLMSLVRSVESGSSPEKEDTRGIK